MKYNKEQLKVKCRNLLAEYEDVLMDIIELERQSIESDNSLGDSEFEIVKRSIMNAGVKEGMKRIMQTINKHAKWVK